MKTTLKTLICTLAIGATLFTLTGCGKKDVVSKETTNQAEMTNQAETTNQAEIANQAETTNQADTSNQSASAPDSRMNAVFDNYDNKIVQGNEATGCIKSYASINTVIRVATKANPSGKGYSKLDSYKITDKSDKNYIDTSADFRSTVYRADNGAITCVTFTQL